MVGAGAARADAALLVVDGSVGGFESGFSSGGIGLGGQTREHAHLARCLGIEHLVIVITKLDTCGFSQVGACCVPMSSGTHWPVHASARTSGGTGCQLDLPCNFCQLPLQALILISHKGSAFQAPSCRRNEALPASACQQACSAVSPIKRMSSRHGAMRAGEVWGGQGGAAALSAAVRLPRSLPAVAACLCAPGAELDRVAHRACARCLVARQHSLSGHRPPASQQCCPGQAAPTASDRGWQGVAWWDICQWQNGGWCPAGTPSQPMFAIWWPAAFSMEQCTWMGLECEIALEMQQRTCNGDCRASMLQQNRSTWEGYTAHCWAGPQELSRHPIHTLDFL